MNNFDSQSKFYSKLNSEGVNLNGGGTPIYVDLSLTRYAIQGVRNDKRVRRVLMLSTDYQYRG